MPIMESELCQTITLIVNNYQKVSNRISSIKKPQKMYEKYAIPRDEKIIAYCEGVLPFLKMTVGFVAFTNKAFYPLDLSNVALSGVPYGNLSRYIVTQDDNKDAVYLRNCEENHMIYSPTIFAKNIGGCEIKTLLEEIQSYSCLHDDDFRSKYQETIESIYARAKIERHSGNLSEGIKALLLSFAAKGSAESIHFLAESQFRLCNVEKYQAYIQGLPISQEMKQKYATAPEEFYVNLKNDMANPACEFSDEYLNKIIDTIEKQKNICESDGQYYRIIRAFALSRIAPIAVREEYQDIKGAVPDENWDRLEDMIHLYGSKRMRRIYDKLRSGDDVSKECFQYVDGLNLTPMHYALMLGRDDLAIEWATNKKCSFSGCLEYTSKVGIWSYGVLAEIVQSKCTKELLLATIPEFVELQVEIKKNKAKLSLCEIKRTGLATVSEKLGKVLRDVKKDDPELVFKTDVEKARIKNMTAEYEAQRAALKDAYKEIDALEREIDRQKAALNRGCREMIDDMVTETSTGKLCCKNCGTELIRAPNAKPRLFCSDRCKQIWWNRHRYERSSVKIVPHTCPICGKIFVDYSGANRKYCSQECYRKRGAHDGQ